MRFIGTGKVDKTTPSKTIYIVEITEDEADKTTGVAGKPHISGRYKPGVTVNISAIYDKVKAINERYAEIVAGAKEIQADALEIETKMPLT